jgi:hypothetical protein
MPAKWTPAPYSLTLDELYTKDAPHSFRHNDIIYVGIMRSEVLPEGTAYVVLAIDAARPTRLLGSTVVTPVTPAPPDPLWPSLAHDSSPPPR